MSNDAWNGRWDALLLKLELANEWDISCAKRGDIPPRSEVRTGYG